MHDFKVAFHGSAATADEISFDAVRSFLDIVADGARRTLRFRLEGRSTAKGIMPGWLRAAGRFTLKPSPCANHLVFSAPQLDEIIPERIAQRDFFREVAPTLTSFDLFEESLFEAADGVEESDLFDDGLIETFSSLRSVVDEGIDSIQFINGRIRDFSLAQVGTIEKLRRQTPPPQAVRVVGQLDTIRHSTRHFMLRVMGSDIRGIASDHGQLKDLWGQRVTVSGTASFRPSGSVLRIEASEIRPAQPRDEALFSSAPLPLLASADRAPRIMTGNFTDAIGKWPGDESDEQLHRLLAELS